MPTTVFEPTRESRTFGRLVGCAFMAIGSLFASVALGLALLIFSAAGEGTPQASDVARGALCCGFPFSLILVGVGAWVAFFAGRDERLVLDDANLTYKSDVLPLARLVRLSTREGWQRRVHYHSVVLDDDAGHTLALEVSQDDYVGTFDVRALLRALLPRLPATCLVDPHVRAYAAGARL